MLSLFADSRGKGSAEIKTKQALQTTGLNELDQHSHNKQ